MTDETAVQEHGALLVCFASAFAYESAPNITHATVDGKKTLCGRAGWQTHEGHEDEHDGDVSPFLCCRRCSAVYAKRKATSR